MDPDQEGPITTAESRSRSATEDDLELMSEDQILEGELASRPKPKDEPADDEEEEFEHPAG